MDMNKIMKKIDSINFLNNGEWISADELKKQVFAIEKKHNIKSGTPASKMIWYTINHKMNIKMNYELIKFVAGMI